MLVFVNAGSTYLDCRYKRAAVPLYATLNSELRARMHKLDKCRVVAA